MLVAPSEREAKFTHASVFAQVPPGSRLAGPPRAAGRWPGFARVQATAPALPKAPSITASGLAWRKAQRPAKASLGDSRFTRRTTRCGCGVTARSASIWTEGLGALHTVRMSEDFKPGTRPLLRLAGLD